MRSRINKALTLLCCFVSLSVLVLASQRTAHAGTGTFRNGAYNFVVSVRWNATQAELNEIKTRFIAGSKLLYEATNGQHYFANITIVNNSGASDEAEYWILPDQNNSDRAYVENLNRYGVRGNHIVMRGKHLLASPTKQGVSSESYRGAYIIVHELGHHSYDLDDEYARPKYIFGIMVGRIEDDTCAPWNIAPNVAYSIMDKDYYNFNGTLKTTEFCVGSEHDPDASNLQSRKFRGYSDRSCWNIIANNHDQPYRRAVKPTGGTSPVTNPTPPPLNILIEGQSKPKVVVDICKNSTSTYQNTYGATVVAGTATSVDYMVNNSSMGVRSFSYPQQQHYPLTQIVSQSTRNDLKSSINGITFAPSTYGVHNDLQASLQSSLSALTSQSSRSTMEHVVLVVRGGTNTAQMPDSLIDSYFQAGVHLDVIYVRGAGDNSKTDRFKQVARETGGVYREVTEKKPGNSQIYSSPVNTEIVNLIQDINGYRRTNNASAYTASNNSISTIHIEPGVESANITVQSGSNIAGYKITLFSPSGNSYTVGGNTGQGTTSPGTTPGTTPGTAPGGTTPGGATPGNAPGQATPGQATATDIDTDTPTTPTVAYIDAETVDSPNSKAIVVTNPVAGDWQVQITPTANTTVPEDLDVAAYVKHDGVSVKVNPRLEEVTLAEPIKLQANASYEGERIVTGLASMTVTVTRPDGSKVTATLYDDGDEAHNDEVAGDGIYSGLFSDYVGEGTYIIETSIDVPASVSFEGESFGDTSSTPATHSTPAFSAAGKATVIVKP